MIDHKIHLSCDLIRRPVIRQLIDGEPKSGGNGIDQFVDPLAVALKEGVCVIILDGHGSLLTDHISTTVRGAQR